MATMILERLTSRKKTASFLEREFPNGAGAIFTTITPTIARELLADNPDNRNPSKIKVGQYASDMRNGKWALNGESIIVADDGSLNDGQQRLLACIEADTSFGTVVCYGVPRETRTTVDQGKVRGAGDYLSMRGFPSANNVAAMAKMALAYNASNGKSVNGSAYVTNADALAYVDTNGEELLDAYRFAARSPKSFQGLGTPTTLLGFCAYLLRDKGALATQYLTQLATGENLVRTDAAYLVRERLAGINKGNRQPRLEAMLRGWLAFKNGKPVQHLRLLGELPTI